MTSYLIIAKSTTRKGRKFLTYFDANGKETDILGAHIYFNEADAKARVARHLGWVQKFDGEIIEVPSEISARLIPILNDVKAGQHSDSAAAEAIDEELVGMFRG